MDNKATPVTLLGYIARHLEMSQSNFEVLTGNGMQKEVKETLELFLRMKYKSLYLITEWCSYFLNSQEDYEKLNIYQLIEVRPLSSDVVDELRVIGKKEWAQELDRVLFYFLEAHNG